MRKQIITDTKEHYKSYKAGKHWVFACMTAATLGLGLTGMSVNASADTAEDNPVTPATAATTTTPTTTGNTQALQKTEGGAANTTDADTENGGSLDANKDSGNAGDATINQNTDVKNAGSSKNTGLNDDAQNNNDATINQKSEGTGTNGTDVNKDADSDANNGGTLNTSNSDGDTTTHNTSDTTTLNTQSTNKLNRNSLLREAPTPTYNDQDIQGVDATVWLPDAGLRGLVEYDTQRDMRGVTITDANLYQYVDHLLTIENYGYTGPTPTTFKGLQYFKNITMFDFTGDMAPENWINFSFAPNLSQFMLSSKDSAEPSMDATTFINSILGENEALQYLLIRNYNLTGNLPDMSNFQNLTNLNLSSNNLTGSLDNIGTLQPNTSLNLADNQLSGPLTLANFKNLQALYISNNNLSGDFPVLDAAANSIILDAQKNHFTSGLQDPTSNQVTMNQIVTGGTYTITPKNRTFDPITHYVSGVLGADGATIDMSDPMTIYGWSNRAGSLFTVTKDTTNKIGFNLTANQDVPDGTYTVWVLNSKTSQFALSLTFTIVNGTDPVVTPPITGNNGSTTTAPTNNGEGTTEAPITGGDGATIDGTAPAKVVKKTTQKTTPATKKTNPVVTKGAAAAAVTTTRHATRPTALASAKSNRNTVVALSKTANKHHSTATTTLPQTNEKRGVSAVAVGVALAISILGLGVGLRRHE